MKQAYVLTGQMINGSKEQISNQLNVQLNRRCVVEGSYHMFNPTVFSFSVLPNGDQVYVSVGGLVALNGHTRAHISIEVKGFPQQ